MAESDSVPHFPPHASSLGGGIGGVGVGLDSDVGSQILSEYRSSLPVRMTTEDAATAQTELAPRTTGDDKPNASRSRSGLSGGCGSSGGGGCGRGGRDDSRSGGGSGDGNASSGGSGSGGGGGGGGVGGGGGPGSSGFGGAHVAPMGKRGR